MSDAVTFAELPRLAQVHRVRQMALRALAEFPIEPRRVRLLTHDFNTSFRVDTVDGRRFALRVNMNEHKTVPQLVAEMAWLRAIADETDINVPQPLSTCDGRLYTQIEFAPLERELPVAVMSWLPGPDLGRSSPDAFRELGRITAGLHRHGERWRLPPGGELPSHADLLVGTPNRLADDHLEIDADLRSVIDEAMRVAQTAIDDVTTGAVPHALHADLHPWNLKWSRGRMSVFDFDDAVIGMPVQDLAISTYYLGDDVECGTALLEGYGEVRTLPSTVHTHLDGLMAGRNLLLLNDVVASSNAGIVAIRPAYVANSVVKLRRFLETGLYRHDVPGLVPISH